MTGIKLLFLWLGSAALLLGCGDDRRSFQAAVVVQEGGLNDGGFNDLSRAGLERAAEASGNITARLYQTPVSLAAGALRRSAAEGAQLSLAVGYEIAQGLPDAAAAYPDQLFASIDAVVPGDNIASLLFRVEQGSYLAGALAGLMTRRGTLGFIGGARLDSIIPFEAGFRAGVRAVNAEAELLIDYTGEFLDPAKGKSAALALYAAGADIIFHASGKCGLGVFAAARDLGAEHLVIGVDVDQAALAPENTLASMLKRVDTAVFAAVTAAERGAFQPGVRYFDLADGGVELVYGRLNVPQAVKERIEGLRAGIKSGAIVVPTQ